MASAAEWMAFLDADDLWFEDHLAELHRIRCAHPDAGLTSTGYLHVSLGAPIRRPERPYWLGLVDYLAAVGRGEQVLMTSSAAIRKQVWAFEGGFGHFRSGQDSELWARTALRWPVAASSRVTACYVHGTGGISESQKTRWLGKPLSSLADVSPAVATLLDRRPQQPPAIQAAIDLYVRRYIIWCVRGSAQIGDIATLQSLLRLPLPPLPVRDRLCLGLARLPDAAAAGMFRLLQALRHD